MRIRLSILLLALLVSAASVPAGQRPRRRVTHTAPARPQPPEEREVVTRSWAHHQRAPQAQEPTTQDEATPPRGAAPPRVSDTTGSPAEAAPRAASESDPGPGPWSAPEQTKPVPTAEAHRATPGSQSAAAPDGTHLPPIIAPGEGFTNLTKITSEPSSRWPVLSRDGSFLVYVRDVPGRGADIYLKRNLTAAAVTRLTTHPATDDQPDLSWDGRWVAFSSNRSGNFDIFVMSTKGGMARRQVTDAAGDERMPSWSPDGHLIAYGARSSRDGRWYIWVTDLRTGARTQYVEGLYPRFSPDGEHILFQRPAPGEGQPFALWSMNLDGTELTQVLQPLAGWGAVEPRWAPDGSAIVFSAARGEAASRCCDRASPPGQGANLWMIRPDGTGLVQLTAHPADDRHPFWGTDGNIYFTTDRDGAARIWRFKAALEPAGPDEPTPQAPASPDPGEGHG